MAAVNWKSLQLELAEKIEARDPSSVNESFVFNQAERHWIVLGLRKLAEAEWQPIRTAPQNEMFIWAYPNSAYHMGRSGWSVGLAYRNVSGGWSDAYGNRDVPGRATLWAPMPRKPEGA